MTSIIPTNMVFIHSIYLWAVVPEMCDCLWSNVSGSKLVTASGKRGILQRAVGAGVRVF